MQTEFVINVLKEQIPAVKSPLFIHKKVCTSTELDIELCSVLFFCFIHQANLFLCPFFCVSDAIGFAYVFFGTQAFNYHVLIFSININSVCSLI